MTVIHNSTIDKFAIVDVSREEIIDLVNSFDYCPLPLKRNFYRLKENILKEIKKQSNTTKLKT